MNNQTLTEKKNWEVADIIDLGLSDYEAKYGKLPYKFAKVINALCICRTAKLGGHMYGCDNNDCDNKKNVYNSCRNRHCPKCQGLARLKWVECRMEELLPVQYFHAVFTVPSELNSFAIRNNSAFYKIHLKAVSETLTELAEDPKHIGAKVGFISVLHTWGQNMTEHPHVHCIVPGGGLLDKEEWISCKDKFLFPIKAVSRLFKGKFMAKFKEAVKSGDIKFHGKLKEEYANHSVWKDLLNQLYEKEWVVYCKKPFAGPDQVLKYLGGYTHRIAISNNRIVDIKDGNVWFWWKDYRDENKSKLMKVTLVEFIRRFLLHILPSGFKRIRYYGFLSNRTRKESLKLCFKLLGKLHESVKKKKVKRDLLALIKTLFGHDLTVCPKCGEGRMVPLLSMPGRREGYF